MAEWKKEWVGKRFGKLLVVAETDPYISPSRVKTRRFICKCDCGNTVTVLRSELVSGRTSCGCDRWEKKSRIDLTGQRFGRLVVEKRVRLDKPRRNGIVTGWLCRCDCGKEVIYTTKDLRNVGTISCGCAISDASRLKIQNNFNQRYDGTEIAAIRPERSANKNSTTGVKGVYWSNREGRYIAKLQLRGKSITIGRSKSLEAARLARLKAEEEYFAPVIAAYEKEKKEKK